MSVEIVLVLYKKMPQESKAFCDLLRHKSALENIGYNILLYNNSPELSIPENKEAKVIGKSGWVVGRRLSTDPQAVCGLPGMALAGRARQGPRAAQ